MVLFCFIFSSAGIVYVECSEMNATNLNLQLERQFQCLQDSDYWL